MAVDLRLVVIVMVLVPVILASYLLFPIDPSLRWALYILLLVAIAWTVIRNLHQGAMGVPPLRPPEDGERHASGELTKLAMSLRRADRGLKYSQMIVALRVRNAFLEKVRSNRGLDHQELTSLMGDPEKRSGIVHDPLILRFLAATAEEDLLFSKVTTREPLLRGVSRGESFSDIIGRVVSAMEAWN